MSTLPTPYITEEQYLEFDRKADFKSQYIDGQMYAMAGAREAHNQLVFAFAGLAFPAVRSRSCRGYGSEMRVRTPRGMNTYPDLSFVCGEARFTSQSKDILLNPMLIVEVLSPTTENFDRGRKFREYRGLESLQDYLLVASESVSAELYSRQADGKWVLTEVNGLDGTIHIPSIGMTLALCDLYEGIDLTQAE